MHCSAQAIFLHLQTLWPSQCQLCGRPFRSDLSKEVGRLRAGKIDQISFGRGIKGLKDGSSFAEEAPFRNAVGYQGKQSKQLADRRTLASLPLSFRT